MNLFATRRVLCRVLIGWLLTGCFGLAMAQLVDEFYYSDQVKPIHGWRILSIDQSNQNTALGVLGNKAAQVISPTQLERLLPQRKIDPSALLKEEIDATIEYAEKRERELKIPLFAKNSSMKKDVELHRAHAKYLSGLNGKLLPYLVRAKLCSKRREAGFGASIDLKTGRLTIWQGCMSRTTIVPWCEPVVVFSEVPVQEVEASVSVDE